MAAPVPVTVLALPDAESLADLVTFVGRAKRLEPDGAIRLVGHGEVLAAYVSPVHGSGGPTVLGLRTLRLADASDLDVTVPLAALTDRFARRSDDAPTHLQVPPAAAPGVAWAGISPPRSGWEAVGMVDAALLRQAADDGIGEVAAGAPQGSGAATVARLRALVWGRDLPGAAGVPAGVAFTAAGLAFLVDGEPCVVLRAGSWVRLTTPVGHVLARRSLL